MGKLYVVGAGSCNYEDFTIKADQILKKCDYIYCDEKMYPMLTEHYDKSKIIQNAYNATRDRCTNAIEMAKDKIVSILGSGDTGIYGISSIIIELCEEINPNLDLEFIPGITFALSGSSLLGAPLTKDFAVITLSDHFFEQEESINRIIAAAQNNFEIVFYSPKNSTYKNLLLAKELLLKYRSPNTLVGITKHISELNQEVIMTSLEELDIHMIDSYTTIFIGRNDTRISNTRIKKMTTPLY